MAKETAVDKQKRSWVHHLARASVLALMLGLGVTAVSAAHGSSAPDGTSTVKFGCEGTMVIANVDCNGGADTMFDNTDTSDTSRYGCAGAVSLRAPWCHSIGVRSAVIDSPEDAVVAVTMQYPEPPLQRELSLNDYVAEIGRARLEAAQCRAVADPPPHCVP